LPETGGQAVFQRALDVSLAVYGIRQALAMRQAKPGLRWSRPLY
jgi:hypothetical protein